MMDDKYSKLQAVNNYDKELVEQLAEAITEIAELEARIVYLKDLCREHVDLTRFIWTTRDGKRIPFHKLEDDHLKSILPYILSTGGKVPKELRAEAMSRNIQAPVSTVVTNRRVIEAEVIDSEEDW